MKLKRYILPSAILFCIFCLVLGVIENVAYWANKPRDVWEFGTGSPKYAEKWRSELARFNDPESATSRHSAIAAKRFANGEWIFGVCKNSHRYRDGGTIVVKDSRGNVRAFFGHVCGDLMLSHGFQQAQSLDEFYGAEWWQGFTEYSFP
jgi:hypothetical protein